LANSLAAKRGPHDMTMWKPRYINDDGEVVDGGEG